MDTRLVWVWRTSIESRRLATVDNAFDSASKDLNCRIGYVLFGVIEEPLDHES